MTLIWQLAWRYLKGKRKANIVPILSRISMMAIAVGSCAMIILFSVFNGFEYLIKDLYKAFYPPVKITAAKGKFFSVDEKTMQNLKTIDGISYVSKVIEDNVWLSANDEETIATLKGIDTTYYHVSDFQKYIYTGRNTVIDSPFATTIAGLHIANKLGLDPNNVFTRLQVYYPNPQVSNMMLNPMAALQSVQLKPDGIFQVQDEFDSRYIITGIATAQSLFIQKGRYTSLEIGLQDIGEADEIAGKIKELLGDSYIVATRFQQNKTLYMVMNTEKWAVYAILFLVLVIASFNMVGALTLLVIEKQKDIAILRAMGASSESIKKIFILEGLLWAFIGGAIGLLVGVMLCWGQQHFGWIRLHGAFVIDAYPVAMRWYDFLLVIATVLVVGFLAAWYPSGRALQIEDPSLKA